MKINEEKKSETRLALIEAAVDVVTEKGFKAASMREIARRAAVGDATIYNYFPSKEKILFGYFEQRYQTLLTALREIEDFDQYPLQEQLHIVYETLLEQFLPDREFVKEAFRHAFLSPLVSSKHMAPTRQIFSDIITDLVNAAVEAGEIEEITLNEWMMLLLWEYHIGILAYWLRDDSQDFNHTTQLIDKSLDVLVRLLKGGVINKSMDLVTFLYRTHLLGFIEQWKPGNGAGLFQQKGNKDERKRAENDEECIETLQVAKQKEKKKKVSVFKRSVHKDPSGEKH